MPELDPALVEPGWGSVIWTKFLAKPWKYLRLLLLFFAVAWLPKWFQDLFKSDRP